MNSHLPLLLVCALPFAACDSGRDAPRAPGRFVFTIDNPYFPLIPGTERIYVGSHHFLQRHEVERTLEERVPILGVPCVALEQKVYLDGTLVEETVEWYAQDGLGNVWKFGETGRELVGGEYRPADDVWIVGENDARPWLAFPAAPEAGMTYSGYRPGGFDRFDVVSLSETVTVPAGTFTDCMKIVENPDDPDDKDIILYAPGVGRVQEKSKGGGTDLVKARRKQ